MKDEIHLYSYGLTGPEMFWSAVHGHAFIASPLPGACDVHYVALATNFHIS